MASEADPSEGDESLAGVRSIPSNEEISRSLHRAWRHGPTVEQANRLMREVPVPGSVALRGRFMLLTDPQGTFPDGAFALDWDTWVRQVELTEIADRALVDNDRVAADKALNDLMATHERGLHPLPVVDALVGLGDAARQADDFETAAGVLDEARTTATASGYRFGSMRAVLSLAYLTLQKGSADDALVLFGEAEGLAADLDDRVFRAGALVGSGEAHNKAGRSAAAVAAIEGAIEIFESIGSHGGVVNASLQLGEIHRRKHRHGEARQAFDRAFTLAEVHGPWIASINALDGSGDVALALEDLSGAAERYAEAYRRSDDRGYARGAAHAANGLGRVLYTAGDHDRAIVLHGRARDLFASLDDHLSQSSAMTGLADVHEAKGDLGGAVGARLDAVDQIEAVRAAQDRFRPQQEFVERFRAVYRSALRTAAKAQDAAAFVAVFEGLGGRRLAGLVGDGAAEVDAPVLGAQMLAFAATRVDVPDEPSRAKRAARLLGRTALRAHLPHLVHDGIDDVAAVLYTEFDRTTAPEILGALREVTALAICVLPGTADQVVALVLRPGRAPVIHRWTLPAATVELVGSLAEAGLPADARLDDLRPLGMLLPPGWDAPAGELLIVPLEQLWAVPWLAVTRPDGRLLGEEHAITLAPSLTLATSEPSATCPVDGTVSIWRSPQVSRVAIQAFDGDPRIDGVEIGDAATAKDLLLQGGTAMLVVVAHGRPVDGVRHILELDDDVYVTPVDLMAARVPPRVGLIACWGAHTPEGPGGEPLTLATLAAARGSEVLCTLSELADDVVASRFVNNVLHHAVDMPFPWAVRAATRLYLSAPARRAGLLARWAPLITVGRPRGEEDGRATGTARVRER